MGDFRKSILQTDFEGEKLARIYLGKIISCTEKNIDHDVYNAEKNLTPLYVMEKISNSSQERIILESESPIHDPISMKIIFNLFLVLCHTAWVF